MPASSAASRSFRQTAIALLLCVLAFSFAIEARMARYGPIDGVGSDLHASRVIQPEIRDFTADDASSAACSALAFCCAFLTILAVGCILAVESRPWIAVGREMLRISSGSYFFPQIAFRPPPAR